VPERRSRIKESDIPLPAHHSFPIVAARRISLAAAGVPISCPPRAHSSELWLRICLVTKTLAPELTRGKKGMRAWLRRRSPGRRALSMRGGLRDVTFRSAGAPIMGS